ncbi:MAG: hypothetical protein WCA19_22910 [Candidatus Acidiferrales bacterium]
MKQPCLVCIFACAALCLSSARVTAQENQVTPRTADGHPDLSGVWNGNVASPFAKSEDPLAANLKSRDGTLLNFERDGTLIRRANPNRPLYKPEFWEKVQKLDQNGNTEDPSFGCMPAGVPRMGPPAKIVQAPTEMIFLHVSGGAQGWGDTFRVIPMDGRPHTPLEDLDGTWKGESLGHWEEDTLVIDTIGFNDTSWLDIGGYFHSENMRVIERLHRDGNTLTWQATVEDPDVLIKPWAMSPRTLKLNPDPKAVLAETLPCVERDLSHLVTKEHH